MISIIDSGATITIDDGVATVQPQKSSVTVVTVGDSVRVAWNGINHIQYPYDQFSAPAGASAAIVAAAIEIMLENVPGAVTVENGTFTLAADGLSATGGALTNPGANPTLTISTSKKLKLWQGFSFKTGDLTVYSKGESDGVVQFCFGRSATSQSDVNCINVNFVGNGWTGLITAINNTSYAITFTQVGTGLAITGQWHGTI